MKRNIKLPYYCLHIVVSHFIVRTWEILQFQDFFKYHDTESGYLAKQNCHRIEIKYKKQTKGGKGKGGDFKPKSSINALTVIKLLFIY